MDGETMKQLFDMDTIQIEITNACIHSCSNCTRFCGHHSAPYFMSFDTFKEAIDSMVGYPNMTGFMGGEPLLHPEFEKFCDYALSKIPREQLGLWSCLPKGLEKYRETICRTFGNVFFNDHTRNDIYHCPVLVAAEEMISHRGRMFMLINNCWLQNNWSASINPKGAFFCEIAAAMSLLFGIDKSWKVEPEWWMRIPKDFTGQMEEYCPKCGCAMPLSRRLSIDVRDDISPKNLERLKNSPKIKKGQYVVSDLQPTLAVADMGSYRNYKFRNRVASRYGMFLTVIKRGYSEENFLEPHPIRNFDSEKHRKTIYEELKEKHGRR